MLRSLFSGVSGMKSNQTKMDVIGNNITNVNTTAFKGSRVIFKDMLSQTMQGASAATTNVGGTNPKQVGLGTSVASIDTDMSQGALQPTSRATDLAIQGNGFFIVANGTDTRYTRDGSFTLDRNGDLVTSEGLHVQGVDRTGARSNVNIPLEHDVAKPLTINDLTIKFYGNDGTIVNSVSINSITTNTDPSKEAYNVSLNAAKDGFVIDITTTDGKVDSNKLEKALNSFLSTNPDGKDLISKGIASASVIGNYNTAAAVPATGSFDVEKVKLTSFGIEKDGTIRAIYGEDSFMVGSIQIATFQNPAGLEKLGSNTYKSSSNSGAPQVGTPLDAGFGSVEQGYLEMSKVDLANEFTEMIITSRAFQANSRTITTSDEMLQELLNLKR